MPRGLIGGISGGMPTRPGRSTVSSPGCRCCRRPGRLASAFFIGALILAPASLSADILPPRLGDFYQTKAEDFTPPEGDVYKEYGFQAAEKAFYAAGSRKAEITALRAQDATDAFAIFEWLRPANAKPVPLGQRGAETAGMTMFQFGNYVIILRGDRPDEGPMQAMVSILPRFETNADPPLLQYLPREGLVPNSGKYILGPVVLAKLAPQIPPSVAAFHYGVEAQQSDYQAPSGRLTLLLFSYPTPQIARQQLDDFQKLPDVMAKRSGPLIAVVVHPFSRDEAEKLLSRVRYEATLTFNERASRKNNIGNLIVNIFFLIGILVALMLAGGLMFGGGRVLWDRMRGSQETARRETEIIRLHLER